MTSFFFVFSLVMIFYLTCLLYIFERAELIDLLRSMFGTLSTLEVI